MAGVHEYHTPKGHFYEMETSGGKVSYGIRWNPGFGTKIARTWNTVQEYVDAQVLRLSEPYIPKDTGILKNSGILNTQIGSGEVKYRTPYARRWYYMPAKFAQGSGSGINATGRGNYWFHRMVREHRQHILEGAKRKMREMG